MGLWGSELCGPGQQLSLRRPVSWLSCPRLPSLALLGPSFRFHFRYKARTACFLHSHGDGPPGLKNGPIVDIWGPLFSPGAPLCSLVLGLTSQRPPWVWGAFRRRQSRRLASVQGCWNGLASRSREPDRGRAAALRLSPSLGGCQERKCQGLFPWRHCGSCLMEA